MKELKGKPVSDAIQLNVLQKLEGMEEELGRKPKLAILRCGENAADLSYERNAVRKLAAFGMEAEVFSFPASVIDSIFMRTFHQLNESKAVDGILLMRPLPKQLNEGFVVSCVDAQKDVDGVSPVSAAGIYFGRDGFAPCTAQAVMELLHHYQIPIEGKHAVIIGRSAVVGKPLAMLLLRENATVTICHSRTKDLPKVCRRADILIAAAGCPRMVTADYIRKGTVVIDVGINTDAEGKLCGDVDFESCQKKARAITPVPGGIGAVTTAVLCKHVLEAAEQDLV